MDDNVYRLMANNVHRSDSR